MNKKNMHFEIDTIKRPNVLLLGNGMLKLGNKGISWQTLLNEIKTREEEINVDSIPYAMQPEALCGADVEEVQRRLAKTINSNDEPHDLLKKLLEYPFDAILTTNYTYEIEAILSGESWTERKRKDAFLALDGNTKVRNNTFVCNVVETHDGRIVPVFHIHGESWRKHSTILSYYSYANSLSRLIEYNKKLANKLYEYQQEKKSFECQCWLDYFIIGNVWSVGFGLDYSEFDIWWAIERKARENADHGFFKAYLEDDETSVGKKYLLESLNADAKYIKVYDKRYEDMYLTILNDIKSQFGKCL